MLLRGAGHLFQCTLQLKYKKVLTSHTLIIASLYGMAFPINSLGWDNLSGRKAKQKANLMYKCINNLAPAYLCNLFVPWTPNYDFRNAKKKLLLPKPRTDYLKRSFSYSAAILWNNLPEDIRTSNSLGFFKRSSHRWFSDEYSHTANM